MLRSDVRNKRRYYVARERLDVSLGQRVLCTVVVDYVPASMRDRLAAVRNAIEGGDPAGLVDVDIIPGEGFVWDEKARVLRAKMPARDVPATPTPPLGELGERINRRVKLLKK